MLTAMHNGSLLAAVDLGSSSIRLEIGRLDHGQIHKVETLRNAVRLGAGLDAERNLTPEAMQRGWDALARFAERLANFGPMQVRAVATQTLREARNRELFLSRAGEILGFPIELICGREEARLIYQGVAHQLPQSQERRLVIDIGGRSTEFILGQGLEALTLESYEIGSVAWSQRFFPEGIYSRDAFERAEVAAKALLDETAVLFPRANWEAAYGSAGTVKTVAAVLSAAGWPAGVITRDGIQWFRRCMLRAGRMDQLRLEGLKEDRRSMIAGGLCVLLAIFDVLQIDRLTETPGALRQGVLYDMVDRDERGVVGQQVVLQPQCSDFAHCVAVAGERGQQPGDDGDGRRCKSWRGPVGVGAALEGLVFARRGHLLLLGRRGRLLGGQLIVGVGR